MSLFHKYLSLSSQDRMLFHKALALSLVVKVMVLIVPLRFYIKYLQSGKKLINGNKNEELIQHISLAVRRCSNHAPWPTKCLVDAITAKILLQWNGINSTLYLGVNKEKSKMEAHAWLKCDEKFVTGQKGFQKYVVVSSFT